MKMRFFDLARKMSQKSEHGDHKIGGVLVKKSRVVSLGWNKCRTHPRSLHPFKNIHAELDCVLGVAPEELRGSTIYLYRENKLGIPSISKPCQWCLMLLRRVGVKKCIYSHNGSFKEEKIT